MKRILAVLSALAVVFGVMLVGSPAQASPTNQPFYNNTLDVRSQFDSQGCGFAQMLTNASQTEFNSRTLCAGQAAGERASLTSPGEPLRWWMPKGYCAVYSVNNGATWSARVCAEEVHAWGRYTPYFYAYNEFPTSPHTEIKVYQWDNPYVGNG